MPDIEMWGQIVPIVFAAPFVLFALFALFLALSAIAHQMNNPDETIDPKDAEIARLNAELKSKTERLRMLEDEIVELLDANDRYKGATKSALDINRRLRELIKTHQDRNAKQLERIADLSEGLRIEKEMRQKADDAANVLHRIAAAEDGDYVQRMIYGKAGVANDPTAEVVPID